MPPAPQSIQPGAEPSPMDVLPINVGFAVEFLDGVMEVELDEIQKMWAVVRKHIMTTGALHAS